MKIVTFTPVVMADMATSLLKSVAANTRVPDRVIVMDNVPGPQPYTPPDVKLLYDYIPKRTGSVRGLNESWYEGFGHGQDMDVFCYLEDDIIISPRHFELVEQALETMDAFAVCPVLVHRPEEAVTPTKGRAQLQRMSRREGWAYCAEVRLLKQVPRFPDEIRTWCLDDWFWKWSLDHGWSWYRILNDPCFHFVGQAMRIFGYDRTKKHEKALYRQFVEDLEHGGKKVPARSGNLQTPK